MKKTFIGCLIGVIVLTACNADNTNNKTTKNSDTTKQPTVVSTPTTPSYTPPAGVDAKVSANIKAIVDGYLSMKNALSKDDGSEAAADGHHIFAALQQVDQGAMTPEQKKGYADLADDMKENAEHISTNSGKIDHQREHFEMLSKDIEDLVKTFGGGQPLYKDFCQMANASKGASWISETKEITGNPYMGKAMPTCGELKEELK